MNAPVQQLGRVLADGQDGTRTRPSFRPPPNLIYGLVTSKGRSAALRRFGILKFKEGPDHAS